jgi:hypothetical protein
MNRDSYTTPRTDAISASKWEGWEDSARRYKALAEQLERELAEAQKDLDHTARCLAERAAAERHEPEGEREKLVKGLIAVALMGDEENEWDAVERFRKCRELACEALNWSTSSPATSLPQEEK